MKKILASILILTLILLSSCTTQEEAPLYNTPDFANAINRIFDDYEELDGQVFIGISGPYKDQDLAYKAATRNAYQMALFYEDLSMKVDVNLDVNTALDRESFRLYSNATYDEDRLVEVAGRLDIVDIQWAGGDIGAVVLAQYIDPPFDIPEEGNFIYADGVVLKYHFIQDSMFAAAYAAAVNLAMTSSDVTTVSEDIITINDQLITKSQQVNLSDLDGFEIVSYSYDPKTDDYTCTARALSKN